MLETTPDHLKKSGYTDFPERQPKPPLTIRRGLAKAVALALIPAGFVAISAEAPHEIPASRVIERYVPRDSAGNIVSIEPDMIIRVEAEPTSPRIDYSVNVPHRNQLIRNHEWCKTPNVLLETSLSPELLQRAQAVETAMTGHDFTVLSEELMNTTSIEAVQSRVAALLATYGVTARFDTPQEGYRAVTYDRPTEVEDVKEVDRQVYVNQLLSQLQALTYIPKEMMEFGGSVDFMNAAFLFMKEEKGEKNIGGVYESDKNAIIIKIDSGPWAFIHELTHALHAKSCAGMTDGELRAAYDEALARVKDLPDYNDTTMVDDVHDGSPDSRWYSRKYRRASGFPTDYSKDNYVELMADLSTTLLRYGQLPFDVNNSQGVTEAHVLDQLVLERLQAAMPGVDIAAFVAARERYPVQTEVDNTLAESIAHHVSPLDNNYTIQDLREVRDSGAIIKPAIKIVFSNGREEYIHSVEEYTYHAKRDASNAYYRLSFNKTGQADFDAELLEKSRQYIQRVQLRRGLGDNVEVRDFGGNQVIVMGEPESVGDPIGPALD